MIPTTTSTSASIMGRRRLYPSAFFLACLLTITSPHYNAVLSLTPSGGQQRVKPNSKISQGGRSFQNSPRKMSSDAAISFSDFSSNDFSNTNNINNNNDNYDSATGLDRVRERILDTANDQLTGGKIRKRKYKRKSIPTTEKEKRRLKLNRQAQYQEVVASAKAEGSCAPNIWSFEGLFPDPVLDKSSIKRDLYSIKDQDKETRAKAKAKGTKAFRSNVGPLIAADNNNKRVDSSGAVLGIFGQPELKTSAAAGAGAANIVDTDALGIIAAPTTQDASKTVLTNGKVDRSLTRLVEDKIFGYRRTTVGQFQYETSLMGDGAIKFREGVRLGNPLPVNGDRLTYMARKELQHGRVEESKEMYERAVTMDPRDGRGYLGLSRCAERRRDFKLARDWLRAGIQNSHAKPISANAAQDQGGNPFLLQALGRLEEKRGHLAEAESLYSQAARSRPSHAAAWVSLAQLRTRKLGQTIAAGRVCYETAERELKKAGLPDSSHVYTAWAALEHKGAGDIRLARKLFESALKVDPRCSAAWLQLGVMEADNDNWDVAEKCFQKVLKFDRRNSRVIQAYALMETRRPDGSSRRAIDLFERALKVNRRDAGVLQPYALYVAELGDLDSARELLRRATDVNKRHAPAWQAWGVLEMRHGYPEEGRKIFQEGIWACAQLAGNQSGGYHCARLWQAWGVLESQEGEHAAARRCFSRALDADSRNVATVTAWTQMEEDLGNEDDARALFERALKTYAPGCDSKMTLWRAYELMEQRAGHVDAAQQVYQRSVRETFNVQEDQGFFMDDRARTDAAPVVKEPVKKRRTSEEEVEFSRWGGQSSMKGEVWMNNGSIESKIEMPKKAMERKQR